MSNRPVILVVDDDAPILLLMQNLLRQFDFEPVTASTGSAAYEAAGSRSPSLILLDKNMPGVNTETLSSGLRQAAGPHVPILILSGDAVEREELEALGADGAIQKPFDVSHLIAQIRERTGSTSNR